MKLTDILNEIENSNPETLDSNAARRDILKSWGSKLALAAIPFAGATLLSKKSSAKTTDILADAIYFALGISYMQSAFYTQSLNYPNLIPEAATAGFKKIKADKEAHIKFWTNILTTTGTPVPAVPSYDFTAKAAINKVFNDYGTFLTVAQAMEDAGVRVYLTVIDEFISNKQLRSDAVNIATTNARHAAHVRLLRRNTGIDIYPWVTGTQSGSIVGEIIKAYQDEDNVMQLKYNVVGINGFDISFESATEAFDEPMLRAHAEIFMKPFIV